MRQILIVLLAVSLSVSVAIAAPAVDRALALTPSGDALWDAYAQLLFDDMRTAEPDMEAAQESPYANGEKLIALEGQFGDDPRYWQLCYFEFTRLAEPAGELGTRGGLEILDRAQSNRAVDDPVLLWLRYLSLGELQPLGQPLDIRQPTPPEQLAVLDSLIHRFPQESLPLYERALLRLASDDYAGGLADLRAGNAAASNRQLLPFPVSFVEERLASGQPLGSEAAAGVVLSEAYKYSMGFSMRSMRIKDLALKLPARMDEGTGVQEIASYHQFLYRICAMDGADVVDYLGSTVAATMLLNHLLTERAGDFTPGQRKALLTLYNNWKRIPQKVRDANYNEVDYLEFMADELADRGIGAEEMLHYVLYGDPVDTDTTADWQASAEVYRAAGLDPADFDWAARAEADPAYRLDITLRGLLFEHQTAEARRERESIRKDLLPIIQRCARFDWKNVVFVAEAPTEPADTSVGSKVS